MNLKIIFSTRLQDLYRYKSLATLLVVMPNDTQDEFQN